MGFLLYKQLFVAGVLAIFSSMVASADETCKSIAELACEFDELSTLCELINRSEVTTNALTNEIFTVFAPINQAWFEVDVDLLDDLVNCTSALNSVFAFHTIYGSELSSSDLECGETVAMSIGDDSRTICKGDKIYQKGSLNSRERMPEIVTTDIKACNGVIHLVDQVMLPKAKYIATCDEEEEPPRPTTPTEDLATVEEDVVIEDMADNDNVTDANSTDCLTIPETICMDADLTVACDLISEAVIGPDLTMYTCLESIGQGCGGDWTVFAPTDDAFLAIEDILSTLTQEELISVLSFHSYGYGEAIYYDDLQCKEILPMVGGRESRTKCDKDDDTKERFKIQKGAGQLDGMMPRIIEPDIETCNGIIHKVNNVMLPKR